MSITLRPSNQCTVTNQFHHLGSGKQGASADCINVTNASCQLLGRIGAVRDCVRSVR